MKAVCVYTPGLLTEETAKALVMFWPPADICLHEIDPADQFAYPRILAEYWETERENDGFAVIEPDIVVRADVVHAFHNCPEPYCCWPYAWLTDVGCALGCTRFSAEFLAEHPDAMRNVLLERVTWNQTDVVLMRHQLARKGFQPHVHLPPVEHLNPKKQLLPNANPEPLMEVPLW